MNQTLEEMARALFKSWFVDFDPVRTKLDGRWRPGESLPGLPADLYPLFPDAWPPSQQGEIPEGWEVGVLADMVELLSGGTPQTSIPEYWDGDIPWYTAKTRHRKAMFSCSIPSAKSQKPGWKAAPRKSYQRRRP